MNDDEDGNKYLDFVGSWGPMILGHSNKQITEAIKKQSIKVISLVEPTKNELEIAKLIKSPLLDLIYQMILLDLK